MMLSTANDFFSNHYLMKVLMVIVSDDLEERPQTLRLQMQQEYPVPW